jgi:hypothetical protein
VEPGYDDWFDKNWCDRDTVPVIIREARIHLPLRDLTLEDFPALRRGLRRVSLAQANTTTSSLLFWIQEELQIVAHSFMPSREAPEAEAGQKLEPQRSQAVRSTRELQVAHSSPPRM